MNIEVTPDFEISLKAQSQREAIESLLLSKPVYKSLSLVESPSKKAINNGKLTHANSLFDFCGEDSLSLKNAWTDNSTNHLSNLRSRRHALRLNY
jgi:hypothetical protein